MASQPASLLELSADIVRIGPLSSLDTKLPRQLVDYLVKDQLKKILKKLYNQEPEAAHAFRIPVDPQTILISLRNQWI